MTLETPAIMAETTGPFRGLTPTAPVADIDARIRRVAGGHLVMADLAIDDIIDVLLVLARRLAPYVDVQHLEGVIIDLDAEVLDADDIEDDDITYWCKLYVDHESTPREEWGVSCGGEKPQAWWPSREAADQCAKRMSMYNSYPRPIVIVPRYIAEPASNTTEA